ncbi:hypothetical protein AMTRI_Chr04g181650 [Amborella trichopoda]
MKKREQNGGVALKQAVLGQKATVFALLIVALGFSEAQTDPNDASVMQKLAISINAGKTLGWTSDTDPCSWKQVYCSQSRIESIQIGHQSLQGTLPDDLNKLSSLVRLELMSNQLSGPLPTLKGLSSLSILIIERNNFSSIPGDFFSGLIALTAVSLDNNPFSPWRIPESLKELISLVNFSANTVNLYGEIPDIFSALPSLNTLALAYNNLYGNLPQSFSGSPVRFLWLNNQNQNQQVSKLNGSISVIQNMTGLVQVWLHSNHFSGPLPDFSGLTSLEELRLRDNEFTGLVPKSLTNLKSLQNISLTNNHFQGPLPQFLPSIVSVDMVAQTNSFCLDVPGDCDPRVNSLLSIAEPLGYPDNFATNWKGNDPCNQWNYVTCSSQGNITILNFQGLNLTGTISPDFSRFESLQRLLLGRNNLHGTIPPELTKLSKLIVLNVSDNSLSGKIPDFGQNVNLIKDGNPDLGKDGNHGGGGSEPAAPSPENGKPSPKTIGEVSKSSNVVTIVGVVIGVLVGVFVVGGLGFFCYRRRQHKFRRVRSPRALEPHSIVVHPTHSGSGSEFQKVTILGSSPGTMELSPGSTAHAHHGFVQMVDDRVPTIGIQTLRKITKNFDKENELGRGGFGTVYKGELEDGTMMAVKRMAGGVIGDTGLTEYEAEIASLSKLRHRNLVTLMYYCWEGSERALVYEYMAQGALSDHLFKWKEREWKPMDWERRVRVALDVARGVEYLHSLAREKFIHRDLKSSNVLLAEDMTAKVGDFGLVRLAPQGGVSIQVTKMAGTFGYLAPEYTMNPRVSVKVDVYSYGVILMELITGRKALEENQTEECVVLSSWFRRILPTNGGLQALIDPSLDPPSEETLESISRVAELSFQCTMRDPTQRPDMGYVVGVLSSLVNVWKPQDEADPEEYYGVDLDLPLPEAVKRWQASSDSQATGAFGFASEDTGSSIPTKPTGFAESFASADGR